jgi:hypothetical protein
MVPGAVCSPNEGTRSGPDGETLPEPSFFGMPFQGFDGGKHGRIVVCLDEASAGNRVDGSPASPWQAALPALLAGLRRLRPLLFLARSAFEAEFLSNLALPGERVVASVSFGEAVRLLQGADAVVSESTRCVLGAAGSGTPGILLGNERHAGPVASIGLPIHQTRFLELDALLLDLVRLLEKARCERDRLLELRRTSLELLRSRIGPRLAPSASPRRLPPDALEPLLVLGSGWFDWEISDENRWRWCNGEATVRVHVHEPGNYRLGGEWCGMHIPEDLVVETSHAEASPFRIGGPGFQSVPSAVVALPRGTTTLRLRAVESPVQSRSDPRVLSFAWRNPAIEAAGESDAKNADHGNGSH